VNVLLPRHGQPQESPQNTLQDRTPESSSGTSYVQSTFPCTSLPSRRKPFAQQQPASNYQHFDNTKMPLSSARTSTTFSSPAMDDDRIISLVVDMDVSTDMSNASERHHSSPDHPTPSTHKTSSSSSFSPPNLDHPSSPKPLHQQQAHSLPGNLYPSASAAPAMQSVTMSQSPTAYFNTTTNDSSSSNSNISPFAAYFHAGAGTSADTEVAENPFAVPPGWDFSVGQASGTGSGAASAGAESVMTPFDEVNWAQTPDIVGWSSWRS
jgi:hypothetical protein